VAVDGFARIIRTEGLSRFVLFGTRLASSEKDGFFPEKPGKRGEEPMLYYALMFLVVALIAGALGFGVVAFAAAGIAKVCFVLFLVMFVATMVMHLTRRSSI
jgi:uncharacterized membrane protein YtjA (UPF0391 family)